MRARMGVEVELLAPAGASRLDLAAGIAEQLSGSVEAFLFPDAEPSKLDGTALFHNLTPGFRIRTPDGGVVAWVVDDITLQADLDRTAAPADGWWRVVSDDRRLIDLAARLVDPAAALPAALEPLGRVFDTMPESGPGGMWRLRTREGLPIAIGAPLPGGRERAAELVTAPIVEDHARKLAHVLDVATGLGFTAPTEGATHVHLDGGPLREPRTFRRFVQLLHPVLPSLRTVLGTNPRCVRLGGWPDELLVAVGRPGWDTLSWEEAKAALSTVPLTKYCDVNVRNLVHGSPEKDTVEIRTLPVHVEPTPIVQAAELFSAVVRWAASDADEHRSDDLGGAIDLLPLDPADRRRWRTRWESQRRSPTVPSSISRRT